MQILDKDIRNSLDDLGFAVIENFLNRTEINQILSFYGKNKPVEELEFYTTHWIKDEKYKFKIHNFLHAILDPITKKHFENSKSIMSYFLIKNIGNQGRVTPHQDWTIVDESKHKAYTLWIPLHNITTKNGPFRVWPKSHKLFKNIRGSQIDMPYASIGDYVEDHLLEDILCKAGDAIIFDHRLVHSSPPNISTENRIAVGHMLIPENANCLHYFQEKDLVYEYSVPSNYLFSFSFGESIKANFELIKCFPYQLEIMSEDDIKQKLTD
jgi:hypothetical protein